MPNFAEALERSAEDIKRPPALPKGSYIFRVTKMPDPPRDQTMPSGEVQVLEIPVAAVSAVEADEDELAAFGNIANTPNRVTFMFAKDDQPNFDRTLFRFKQFAEHCGLDVENMTVGQMLRELPNAQFLANITHRLDKNDPEVVYAQVQSTAPAP